MNWLDFTFCGQALRALPSGGLWWPDAGVLCVSDLHLGKSERIARRSGYALPPYEVRDTLTRLEADIAATRAQLVICLGDSFDDQTAAEHLPEDARLWIIRLQAGRRWVWIEGNHDPGPTGYGGTHLHDMTIGPLVLRHIAQPDGKCEVSGHYHPKAQLPTRGRLITRPAFLFDDRRLILPAYGTYTGGLRSDAETLRALMQPNTLAILTGPVPTCVPMPR